MKKKIMIVCTFCLISLGIITFFLVLNGSESNIDKKQQLLQVSISARPLPSALPIYVAYENHYFEKYGLKPDLVEVTSGNQVFNSVIKNELDIGEMPIDPFLYAEEKADVDAKIFLVSRVNENSNRYFDGLFVKNNSDIDSLSDLEGKKIGVFPGITSKTFLTHYLTKNGVKTEEIELIELSPSLHIQSLESGSIDVLYAYQTTYTLLEKQGYKNIDNSIFNKLDADLYTVYLFSADHINSGNADKSRLAINDALEFIKNNETESRQILSKYLAIGNLTHEMKYYPNYHFPTGSDSEGVNELIKFYHENELIKTKFNCNHCFYKRG